MMSETIIAVFLDFDGVVADTEPAYAIFWGGIADKYQLGVPDFTSKVKGMTMEGIFERYFPSASEEERQKIVSACQAFELEMDFREIPGSLKFINLLKQKNYKVGLVTSSPDLKMQLALRELGLEGVFDTVVTANRISRGKPDPMCYLLAAEDLGVSPQACVVFEDSFLGIEAARRADMKVIGLSTTNPAEAISEKTDGVVANFLNADEALSYIVN